MHSEVFCPACADTGLLPIGVYEGDQEHYAGDRECDQCPVCPCGDPFAAHAIQPDQLVREHGEFWAPECLNEFQQEASNGTL
jgi:hypothetical protein